MSVSLIVLVGPPGSGKGTQAKRLSEKNPAFVHISTGDLFRKEIASRSVLGNSVQSMLDSGKLVPDDVTNQVFQSQVLSILEKRPDIQALLLDGYPRTGSQSAALLKFVASEKRLSRPAVVEMEIQEETLIERLSGRLINPRTGKIYHKVMNPPKQVGICDEDGLALTQRPDDQPAVIRDRYKVYTSQRDAIVGVLQEAGCVVHTLNAEGNPDKIAQELGKILTLLGRQ